MDNFEISKGNSIPFEYIPPNGQGVTFTCFNALTGDRGMWVSTLGDRLRSEGHGLLVWNFRGQPGTLYTVSETSDRMIVEDALALFGAVQPVRPVHVGLSIGGLFALQAHRHREAGGAKGIVLINTLRKPGPRLDWINHAVVRMAETGGLAMMRDFYSPLLFTENWQAANRAQFFETPYAPLATDDGSLMLLKSGITADWDVPYEEIDVPVLSITGTQDRIFRDPAAIDELAARIPRLTRLDLEEAGHMVPLEQPSLLADAMIAFAKQLD